MSFFSGTAQQRLAELSAFGNLQPLSVEERPFADLRAEQFLTDGVIGNPDDRLVQVRQGHHGAEVGNPAGVVSRAVQGIHNPSEGRQIVKR